MYRHRPGRVARALKEEGVETEHIFHRQPGPVRLHRLPQMPANRRLCH